jgi:hypothetical protein
MPRSLATFASWLTLRPSKWRPYVPPKRRRTSTGLYSVTSQKTVISGLCEIFWRWHPIAVREAGHSLASSDLILSFLNVVCNALTISEVCFLVLCRHEDVWGSGCIAPSLLSLALPRGEWSASRLCYFTSGKEPPYRLYRRLGGPQSRSGRCGEGKNLSHAGNRTPAVHPTARHYINWAIPVITLWIVQWNWVNFKSFYRSLFYDE